MACPSIHAHTKQCETHQVEQVEHLGLSDHTPCQTTSTSKHMSLCQAKQVEHLGLSNHTLTTLPAKQLQKSIG